MSDVTTPLIRVRNWDQLYENNRSRDMKRTNWFPVPNDLSADSYVELVDHPEGAAHLGIWHAILMVASRAKLRRGLLIKEDGRPHAAESLARVMRLPEVTVQDAIKRLLQIGLLETDDPAQHKINDLPPHPGAGNPQEPAVSRQEGAVEGKGREHHHQEEKGMEKKRKRTEPQRTERAHEEVVTEDSRTSASAAASSSQRGDDADENAGGRYASPEDELKAIYRDKSGQVITVELLDAIRVNLELARVNLSDFVEEVRKHAGNKWNNPPGFLRDLSKRFRAKTRAAAGPVTAAEAQEKNYRCESCGSRVRGEGAILEPDNKAKPCTCASPEYIARQRERGLFEPEATP